MANLRSIISRYRWITFYVLLILACLTARYVIVWYKTRPPNHVRIYDLTWSDIEYPNNTVYHRWRYYLKPSSYLPSRVEKYSRADPNDDYVLEETLLIDYPTDEQIRQVIKDAGFQFDR